MASPQLLTGNALANWLVDQLMSPDGKVSENPEALEQTRAMLARTKDLAQLRDSVEALGALAEALGGKLKQVKVGESILKVMLEVHPRFHEVLAERSIARTEAARDTKDLLGGAGPKGEAPKSDHPTVSANKLRGPMRG
jgi:hypothetical protein